MKRAVVLITALSLFLLPTGGALAVPEENPFQGHWVGMDPPVSEGGDGSRNTLTVSGGNNQARYQEDGLTACSSLTGSPSPGFASGFATIENGTLMFVATVFCIVPGTGLVPSEALDDPFTFEFTDNEDGTIQFPDGALCLHRPSEPEACA